jgi:hypothetical protein
MSRPAPLNKGTPRWLVEGAKLQQKFLCEVTSA